MYEPSRDQRREIEQTLKGFAFEQSPMFQKNLVQGMSAEFSYRLHDDWEKELPKELVDQGPNGQSFSPDETNIRLGFEARRYKSEYLKRPVYHFLARSILSAYQLPQQINMPSSAWAELGDDLADYIDDDHIDNDNYDENQILSKQAIVNYLSDNMISCEKYRQIEYEYDTFERIIRLDDETGYIINGAPYGVINSHPTSNDDLTTAEILTLSSESPSLADLSVNDAQFEQTISGLRDHYNEYGDLLSHEDKFNELNYLLQVIKRRYLDLR